MIARVLALCAIAASFSPALSQSFGELQPGSSLTIGGVLIENTSSSSAPDPVSWSKTDGILTILVPGTFSGRAKVTVTSAAFNQPECPITKIVVNVKDDGSITLDNTTAPSTGPGIPATVNGAGGGFNANLDGFGTVNLNGGSLVNSTLSGSWTVNS